MDAERRLLKKSREALARLKCRAAVDVALVPNAALRRLKRRYLKKDAKEVDVLAFPARGFPSPDRAGGYLGEVYVNRTIAARNFPRALFLLIHGMLHLLGYRHGRKRDTIVMERLEKKLFSSLYHGNAVGLGTRYWHLLDQTHSRRGKRGQAVGADGASRAVRGRP